MKKLNKHHLTELTPQQIYAGRGSIIGNPFPTRFLNKDRELSIALHREYFLTQLANSTIVAKTLWEIPLDNDLVCFCAPKSCHLDIMIEFKEETKSLTFKEARSYFLNKYNYVFLPELEGKTHINVYSKSLTELGQLTSNFAHTPFEHPVYGKFNSMEGFWFYVGTGFKYEELRELHGNRAKIFGGKLEKVRLENFEDIIVSGIRAKVEQTPRLKKLLEENHLPFKHYYFYGEPKNCKTVKEGNGLLERTYGEISRELGVNYKVIIAGSRTIKDVRWMTNLICESGFRISEIVGGEAKGVDTFAKYYANINLIPFKAFPVNPEDWEKGKSAGMKRNIEMGNYADKAIIGIEGNSKGSLQMEGYMKRLGKETFVKHY